MATTLATIRKINRERQRTRRARLAEIRAPNTSLVDNVLVEALNFSIHSARQAAGDFVNIDPGVIAGLAVRILVDRYHLDEGQSRQAVARRLRKRSEHDDPSFVPTRYSGAAAA
jgi:hypothetical protein